MTRKQNKNDETYFKKTAAEGVDVQNKPFLKPKLF